MGDQGVNGSSGGVRFGFFGKIPSRGDFVSAGLPRSFVTPWDAWLQRMMAESQARLGEEFAAAWDAAPVWRFRLAPGCRGPLAALGVLMPSADRVGRRFPLTIACVWSPMEDGTAPGDDWLEAAEAAGRAAVSAGEGPDELMARVRHEEIGLELGRRSAETGGEGCRWWRHGMTPERSSDRDPTELPNDCAFARLLF